MSTGEQVSEEYRGFEQGPIRPPSEARSLLVRVTRNCPWNRCSFCPVYKGAKFSIRPVDHVKRDIDAVHRHIERLLSLAKPSAPVDPAKVNELAKDLAADEAAPFAAAFNWLFGGGMRSVFLQDANSLVMKTEGLVEVLTHLKRRFPEARRITSYARARTVAAKKDDELAAIRDAGLDRIHLGLESGSDQILAATKKGVTKDKHIVAGRKAKKAGMELSEYVMPGLGGRRLSKTHALETAEALNQIDPDFIRIRTLAIPPGIPLHEEYRAGQFEKCTDLMIAEELLLFVENLEGISSVVKSDHILNLFMDLQGRLPRDRERMLNTLRTFLKLDPAQQRLYQVGRRLGIFNRLVDMESPGRLSEAEKAYRELGVTPGNVDRITDELMARFV